MKCVWSQFPAFLGISALAARTGKTEAFMAREAECNLCAVALPKKASMLKSTFPPKPIGGAAGLHSVRCGSRISVRSICIKRKENRGLRCRIFYSLWLDTWSRKGSAGHTWCLMSYSKTGNLPEKLKTLYFRRMNKIKTQQRVKMRRIW